MKKGRGGRKNLFWAEMDCAQYSHILHLESSLSRGFIGAKG